MRATFLAIAFDADDIARMDAPRRIIFSRKGFDTVAGGCPSPIVDGRPVSLPIPTGGYPGGRPYASLAGDRATLVEAVTRGRLTRDSLCHLDPDIDPRALDTRPDGWRGAFGQVGAAQGHLRNQGVGPGDLFLFFGLFRAVDNDRCWIGSSQHMIFGWLRVGEVVTDSRGPDWLAGHPHATDGWHRSNTIYLAADRLNLPGVEDLPGSGMFPRGHRLSADDKRCSVWNVPDWLERNRMTYRHHDRHWSGKGRMDARGQWQEAVATADDDAIRWAAASIAAHG